MKIQLILTVWLCATSTLMAWIAVRFFGAAAVPAILGSYFTVFFVGGLFVFSVFMVKLHNDGLNQDNE